VKLQLASCQFQIEADIATNRAAVLRHMRIAKRKGAQLAHFSEGCLSGYFGAELKSAAEVDWPGIESALREVMTLAAELQLWVVLGSAHRLSGRHRPHNSLYVIDDRGQLVSRYDKLFYTGKNAQDQDLSFYSPGEELVTFDAHGVCCGLLICHDFRYPELFREYKRRGVELMLVSFHNAGMQYEHQLRYLQSVPFTLQAAAASNYFAVSATNSTRRYAWPSFVVNQEGSLVARAPLHRGAVLLSTIDTEAKRLRRLRILARPRHGRRPTQWQDGAGPPLGSAHSGIIELRWQTLGCYR
jgi:predicted amidohydrolase